MEDALSHLQKLSGNQKLSELFQTYEEAEEKAKYFGCPSTPIQIAGGVNTSG